MNEKYTLNTNACQIDFYFSQTIDNQWFDLIIKFSNILNSKKYDLESALMSISKSDLSELVKYFRTHINNLKSNPNFSSYVFTPTEVGFRIQALAGDIFDDEGDFTLRVMANIGQNNIDSTRAYMGIETPVDLESILEFIGTLEKNLLIN